MRTLELIKSLSKKELKLVEEQVATSKRKSLAPLLKELKRLVAQKIEPSRAELFKKAFNAAYSKDKDYLLRNELRLLNELMYELLVVECFKEHVGKNKSLFNRWLAQSYYNRRTPLFGEDINDFINEAKKLLQTDELSALHALNAAWTSAYRTAEKEKVLAQINAWEQDEKIRFLHRLRKIEYTRLYFEENIHGRNQQTKPETDDWSVPGKMTIDFSDIDKSDWYTRYLTLQKYYWQSKGDTQLKYLEEVVKISGSPEAKNVIKTESHITSLEAMAFSLFVNGRHQEADDYMQAPLALYEKHKLVARPTHVVIYMTNELLLERFDKAINLYDQYKANINLSTSRGHAIMTSAYCYLFIGNADEALNMVALGPELDPNELLHIRYVYAAAFILRKQYALAQTEIRNLRRMLTNANLGTAKSDLEIADYFQSYVRALQKEKGVQRKMLEKLNAEIVTNFAKHKPAPHHNLQLNWLAYQLKASR